MPDQVPKAIKQARAREMITLGEAMQHRYQQSFLGRTLDVLFESWSPDSGLVEGYTDNYLRVQAPSEADLSGQIIPVSLLESQGDLIAGTLAAQFEKE